MDPDSESLWLHAYSGRENGLMVVGTAAALRSLARQLLTGVESASNAKVGAFPLSVATPKVVGPYKDIPGFTLSFHLPGSVPLGQAIPLRRRSLVLPLLILVTFCTIIGVVAIARWVFAHAL